MFQLTGDTRASFPNDLALKDMIFVNGQKWVPFYTPGSVAYDYTRRRQRKDAAVWGGDMALQIMEIVARLSPTHSACINAQGNYIYGKGLVIQDPDDKKAAARLKVWNETMNSRGNFPAWEIRRIINDYCSFGNAPIMVSESKGTRQIFYESQWNCRLEKPNPSNNRCEAMYLSPNFFAFSGNKRNPEGMQRVPIYGKGWHEMDGGAKVAMYQLADPSPAFSYYGYPKSGAAHLSAWNEYRASKFVADTLENGFFSNVLMQFVNATMDKEKKDEFKRLIKDEFTGDGASGALFMQVVGSKEEFANVQTIPQLIPKEFVDIIDSQAKQILVSNRMPAILAVPRETGSLGTNAEEMRNAYEWYYKNVIAAEAETISQIISELMWETIGARMVFEQNPPFGEKDYRTLNERRAAAIVPLPEVEGGNVIPL